MGWLIDPEERSLIVYPSAQQPEFLHEAHELLPLPALFADLQFTVVDVFNWLKL
mgnify:FL=1